MKKPFPVSIEDDLATWIINEVKKGKFRNRSHLVEEAINEFKSKKRG